MGEMNVSIETLIGMFSAAIAGLSGCVGYLFKLHYSDNNKRFEKVQTALDECEQRHEVTRTTLEAKMDAKIAAEQAECEARVKAYQVVIEKLEARIDSLLRQIAEYFTHTPPPKS